MKKILTILFLIGLGFGAKAQWPLTQGLGNDSALIRVGQTYNGGIKGLFILGTFSDTSSANNTPLDYYAGGMIFTTSDTSFWIRNKTSFGTYWFKVGGAGGGAGGNNWTIGGNPFTVVPAAGPRIGTTAVGGSNFIIMTNGVDRLNFLASGLANISASTDSVLGRTASGNVGLIAKSALGGSIPISSLTAATGTNTLAIGNFAQVWTANALSADALSLTSAASSSSALSDNNILRIVSSGANTNASVGSYGINVSAIRTGTTSTNVAGKFESSGASTNNHGVVASAAGVGSRAINASVSGNSNAGYAGFFDNTATSTTTQTGIIALASGTNTNNVAGLFLASGAINDFALNITGGGIGLSGSMGTSGQVLTSAGNGAIPTWTTPALAPTTYAMEFDDTRSQNVYHGIFWPINDSFTVFFWEAWVKPYDGAEYIISDGYSGEHCLLFGFSGGSTTTAITGNVYQDGAATSFASVDTIYTNKIYHVAVGYDGTNIITYVNGVPSKKTPYTGFRRTNGAGAGALYVGGSDHSNFNGLIYRIRGFEFVNPLTSINGVNSQFWPQHYYSSQTTGTVFVSDYSGGQEQMPDLSSGFLGTTHSGVRNYALVPNVFAPNHQTNTGLNISDTLLPQYVQSTFEQPTHSRTPVTPPVGVKIFDSFQREDNTPAWEYWPSLGSTESGSAGQKTWALASENVTLSAGILSGNAYINNLGGRQSAVVTLGDTIQDVRVTKAPNSSTKTIGVTAKFKDADNNLYFTGDVSLTVHLYKYIAGAPTSIGNFVMPASYNEIRLVVGTVTADLYIDGVIKISGANITGLPSGGTKCGITAASPFDRISQFAVY